MCDVITHSYAKISWIYDVDESLHTIYLFGLKADLCYSFFAVVLIELANIIINYMKESFYVQREHHLVIS